MEISARNQLRGRVTGIKVGSVMAEVQVEIEPGAVAGAITRSSADRLALKEGDTVTVIVKATDVMIGKG